MATENNTNTAITTYKVLATNGVTVLKKTALALKDIEATLKKDQTIEDVFPTVWIQGEWTNVVVNKGDVLTTTDYEPNRLRVLAEIGSIEKIVK